MKNEITKAAAIARILRHLPKWRWDAHSAHAQSVIIGWEIRAMKNANIRRTAAQRNWEAREKLGGGSYHLNQYFWERAERQTKAAILSGRELG